MIGRRRIVLVIVAMVIVAAAVAFWPTRRLPAGAPASTATSHRGGTLIATLRSEPPTFNRYSGSTYATALVNDLTQAPLVRINQLTQAVEPWLADRWTRSADGRQYTLHLREDVVFSDGHPFTADDVAFSFNAAYDAKTASVLGDVLKVGEQPLSVSTTSPHEVVVTFPQMYGPGLRLLDNLPIYPKHRLAAALAAGTLATAWRTSTPPNEVAGLGPFVLTRYEPAVRLVFERNPHYWRVDAGGQPLPYLDRIAMEIVPDQNAELLRLQAGQIDLLQDDLRPEDYVPLKREADAGRVRLMDVGTGLDMHVLWFNLGPRTSADTHRAWLQRAEFRRGLSHAVDRRLFARTVYLGAAEPSWGLVSPANTVWYSAGADRPDYDPDRARALFASIGLRDRNADGQLESESGAPVRFSVLIVKGVGASEKGAAFLREALARLGVTIDVVALDLSSVVGHWTAGDYDAIYNFLLTDPDPAANLDLWLSSGSGHVWNPRQVQPATPWERDIDSVMARQAGTIDPAERRQLFEQVQRTIAEHLPAMSFAIPHVYVATSTRVASFTPALKRPQVLWNADEVSVIASGAR